MQLHARQIESQNFARMVFYVYIFFQQQLILERKLGIVQGGSGFKAPLVEIKSREYARALNERNRAKI